MWGFEGIVWGLTLWSIQQKHKRGLAAGMFLGRGFLRLTFGGEVFVCGGSGRGIKESLQ